MSDNMGKAHGAASELLPCPFCGQPPRTSPYRKDMVHCNNYACILFDASDEPNWYSIREWNTRTPAPVMEGAQREASPTDASGGVTEDALWKLLPRGAVYLDPPDGGDVPLIEQLRRMSEDAAKWRELEAADRARKPVDASAQAGSAEPVASDVRVTMQCQKCGAIGTADLHIAPAAPTDVAAYREVTLDDARIVADEYIAERSHGASYSSAAYVGLKKIGAVIRTDGQQAQPE